MFSTILSVIGLILAALAGISIGSGLLVLLAYGVGLVVNQIMHFEPFQATALSLVGVLTVGWLGMRFLANVTSPQASTVSDDEIEDEDEDEEDDEEDENDSVSKPPVIIRNWRSLRQPADFSKTQPEDRCPCGSGRKYKNCHGRRGVRS